MGWLVATGYVAVWLVYGWRLSLHLLDAEVQRSRSIWGSAEEAADNWRDVSIFGGFGLALFWPIVGPVRFAYYFATEGGLFRTPTEREESERRELEELRKLARENGLPVPGYDREKGAA